MVSTGGDWRSRLACDIPGIRGSLGLVPRSVGDVQESVREPPGWTRRRGPTSEKACAMKIKPNDAYTYMGLLDDSVTRFPWRFKLDAARLNHLLAVELVDGKPLLLNDGYLVNNDFIRASLQKRDGLVWELMRNGFIRVMSRGGDAFGLHELPERMAPQIPSFGQVVGDRNWPAIRESLRQFDSELRASNGLIPWPSFDAGSGFLALIENLRERGVSAHALGLGRHVRTTALRSLLDEVAGALAQDSRAARTTWERAVHRHADDPDCTNDKRLFVTSLMNLANEMYHYNMGILLAADFQANVSVQTQCSAAFDDLLIPPSLRFLIEDVPTFPRLHVPLAITQVDPIRLASIVRPGSAIHDARARWVGLRAAWEDALPGDRASRTAELRDSGDEYAKRLSEFVGGQVKFKESEELVEFLIGDVAKAGAAAAAGAAIAAAGGPAALISAGTIGALALGYVVTRARKRVLGGVFKKVRIQVIDRSLKISPRMAALSDQALRVIKRRQVPSTIQIAPSVVTAMGNRLRRFKGPA